MILLIRSSLGAPSETSGAVDFDVSLIVADNTLTGEVTLTPNSEGRLDRWGDSVQMWASPEIARAIAALGPDAGGHLADEIVAACVGDEVEVEVEIDDGKIRDLGWDGGVADVREWCHDNDDDRALLRRMRSDDWDESAISAGAAASLGIPAIFAPAYYEGFADGAREEHLALLADLDVIDRGE